MLMVSGLDRAENIDGRNIRTGKGAVVYYLFDARASRSDSRCQIGQAAGAVADDCGKAAKAAIRNQASFNYATENVRIDVATAKEQHHSLASELFQLSRHTGGKRRG